MYASEEVWSCSAFHKTTHNTQQRMIHVMQCLLIGVLQLLIEQGNKQVL